MKQGNPEPPPREITVTERVSTTTRAVPSAGGRLRRGVAPSRRPRGRPGRGASLAARPRVGLADLLDTTRRPAIAAGRAVGRSGAAGPHQRPPRQRRAPLGRRQRRPAPRSRTAGGTPHTGERPTRAARRGSPRGGQRPARGARPTSRTANGTGCRQARHGPRPTLHRRSGCRAPCPLGRARVAHLGPTGRPGAARRHRRLGFRGAARLPRADRRAVGRRRASDRATRLAGAARTGTRGDLGSHPGPGRALGRGRARSRSRESPARGDTPRRGVVGHRARLVGPELEPSELGRRVGPALVPPGRRAGQPGST